MRGVNYNDIYISVIHPLPEGSQAPPNRVLAVYSRVESLLTSIPPYHLRNTPMNDPRSGKLTQARRISKYGLKTAYALILAATFGSLSQDSLAQQRLTPAQQAQLNEQIKQEVAKVIADQKRWIMSKEGLAYASFVGSVKHPELKTQYMQQLSEGGKIYFLTCRQDYAEALKLLDKFPKRETGSALYLRAKCLDGQRKRLDAIGVYDKAAKKIGKGFSPGFRFYLHYAAAQAAAGKDVEALKNLRSAAERAVDAEKYSSSKTAVAQAVMKRVGYLQEKRGKYKEAFDNYLAMFGEAQSQFHLDQPIEVDASVKSRAGKWLKEHPTPPVGADSLARCKYLTTAAKAHLALGDEKKAKETLEQAIAVREKSSNEIPSELTEDPFSVLSQARDVASSILIRLDIRDKDYKSACKHIRATFVTDPARDDQKMLQCISMADIPDLLTKKDRDLHSSIAEQRLDMGAVVLQYVKPKS